MTTPSFRILPATVLVTAALIMPATAQETNHAAIMAQIQAQEEHVGVWQRYPLANVPLLNEAPVIDGTVNEREWFGAGKISRLIDYNKGLAVRDRTDILLGYTATHLYMAFQMERPEGSLAPTEKDMFEWMFDVTHKHARFYDAAVTNGKLLWSGMGPNLDRKAWQTNLEYKSRVTEWGWEGEIAIPFAEFGLQGAPAPGTVWGADFVRNEHTPTDRLALWSFRGINWAAVKNLGHLVFTGQPIAVRAEGVGWMPDEKQAGLKLEVRNFSSKPVEVKADLELRKAGQPVQMEFYPRIDSAMAENLPAAIGSPLKAEVENALQPYAVQRQASKSIMVPANSSKLIELVEPDEPGNYLAGYAVRVGGQLVAGGMFPAEISVPLAIKTQSYLYSAGALEYEVDLRRVASKISEGASLNISVQDPAGKTIAQQTQVVKPGSLTGAGLLNFQPIPDANLKISAAIVNAGQTVARNSTVLRVPPKPVWLDNQIGKSKFVPEPFTPIEASANKIGVSTAAYEWTNGALLPDVKVFGKPIFASPAALTFAAADGSALPLKIDAFKLVSKDIEQADYEFSGTIGGRAAVTGTIHVEFDGLAWYRLKIAPGAPLQLSASALEFKLKPEYSRLCTVGGVDAAIGYAGGVPADGLKSPFSFSYWLGDREGGIQWFAENQRDWYNANVKNVAQITRGADGGSIKVNFIDRPVTLDKPIEWSFGFIATPSRKLPKDWGRYSFLQHDTIKAPLNTPLPVNLKPNEQWELGNRWAYYNNGGWDRDKGNIYSYIHHSHWQEIFGYPGSYDAKNQQALSYSAKFLHKEGIKTIVYAGWGMNASAPEWADYGMEMVRLPLYNSGYGTFRQEPSSLWTDWFMWKTAEMVKDYDIDGLFIDSVTSPVLSENYTPGMRWIDETGKVRGSYPILASREWLKRLYKMFHGELKQDGIIYNHNSPPAIMAIETFSDVRCPSEFAQTHAGEFDKNFLEFFEAKNAGEQFGLFCELTNKDWAGEWAVKKTPQAYALALPLNVSIKSMGAHFNQINGPNGTYDLLVGKSVNQMMPWIWAANKWAERSTAEYLPWWKNGAYISTAPADDQVIHALWLHKGKKALLCVSNLKNAARKVEVQLDLTALGMKAIVAQDAVTGETIATPGGKLSLDIDFERFRLLKITPQ